MANINFNKRDPIYLQVIDHFRRKFVSDQFFLGEELPSRREIARQLGINPNTVQRAFSEMEENNWIFTEPNRPSQVTFDAVVIEKIKRDFVQTAVKEFVASIQTIDISYQEVADLLAQEIKNQETVKQELKKEDGGTQDD